MRAQDQGEAASQIDKMRREMAAQITNIENKVNSQNSEMQTQNTQLNQKIDQLFRVLLKMNKQASLEE